MKKIFICISFIIFFTISSVGAQEIVMTDIYVNNNKITGNLHLPNTPNHLVTIINDRAYLHVTHIADIFNFDIEENEDSIIFKNSTEMQLYAYNDMNISDRRGGYKDCFGNIVLEPIFFNTAFPFGDGLAPIYTIEGDVATEDMNSVKFIDTQGELQCVSPFTVVSSTFKDGIAYGIGLNVDEQSGNVEELGLCCDTNGDILSIFNTTYGQNFNRVLTSEITYIDKTIYINETPVPLERQIIRNGNETFLPLRDIAEFMNWGVEWKYEEYAHPEIKLYSFFDSEKIYLNDGFYYDTYYCERSRLYSQNKFGYVDTNGETVIEPQYADAYDFVNNIALVSEINKNSTDYAYYYIDKNGIAIFNKAFEYARSFSEGFAAVVIEGAVYPKPTDNIRWSFIDNQGNFATDMKFEDVRSFKSGYAKVKQNGKWGVIDTNFNVVVDFKYDRLLQLVEDIDFIY